MSTVHAYGADGRVALGPIGRRTGAYDQPMIEECFCCGAFAPSWETEEYGEWTLEVSPEGVYLGVICPGCFAGEGLCFLEVEPPGAVVVALPGGTRAGARRGGGRLAEAA